MSNIFACKLFHVMDILGNYLLNVGIISDLWKKPAQAAFIEKRMPYTLGLSQQRVKKSPRAPHYKGDLTILLNLLNVVCPR